MSAQLVGQLKAEREGGSVVVYGSDLRLNHVPDGVKIKAQKF
jgi:hypothetical protein